jgi:hypothetical protein
MLVAHPPGSEVGSRFRAWGLTKEVASAPTLKKEAAFPIGCPLRDLFDTDQSLAAIVACWVAWLTEGRLK